MTKYLIIVLTILQFSAYSQSEQHKKFLADIKLLDSVIKFEPFSENFYYRGDAKYRIQQYDGALADFNKAISLNSSEYDFFFSRGHLLAKMNKHQEAVADFTKCIFLKPQSSKAYFSRAFSKSNAGNNKAALEDYAASLQINPDQKGAHLNMGIIKQILYQYEEAIADFDKAIKIDPSFLDAITNRGISRAMVNQPGAVDDFNLAIQLDQTNGESYYNRAMFYLNHKVKGDYCADLKQAVKFGYFNAKEVIYKNCK